MVIVIVSLCDEELDVTDPKSSDSDSSDGHSGDEEAPLPSDQSLFSHSSDHSETTDSDASRCDTRSHVIEHTITFKYTGTTKSSEYQNILSKAIKELSLIKPTSSCEVNAGTKQSNGQQSNCI